MRERGERFVEAVAVGDVVRLRVVEELVAPQALARGAPDARPVGQDDRARTRLRDRDVRDANPERDRDDHEQHTPEAGHGGQT